MNTYHTDLTNKSKHLFTKQKWSAEFNNKSLFLKFFVLLFLEKKTIKKKSNKTRLPVSITKLMDQSSNTATVAHQWHLDHSCWGFSSFLYYPKRGDKGKRERAYTAKRGFVLPTCPVRDLMDLAIFLHRYRMASSMLPSSQRFPQ